MHDYTHYEDDIPRNDIMMLKLNKVLEPTNNINFVCLPNSRFDTPKPGDKCTIAGWGVNSNTFIIYNLSFSIFQYFSKTRRSAGVSSSRRNSNNFKRIL